MSSAKPNRTIAIAIIAMALANGSAVAQKKFDTGATDTEIKIGNTMPYSGPASAYGVVGKTEEAYFKKTNAEGGINGRKINFISYDDATADQRRWSKPANSSKAMKFC
jgi:branched-chain amino acid transport system substrate-binding protein